MTAYNAWGMRGGTCEIIGNYMVFMGFYGGFMVLCFLTAYCVHASSRIPRHTGKMPHPGVRGSSSPVSSHTHRLHIPPRLNNHSRNMEKTKKSRLRRGRCGTHPTAPQEPRKKLTTTRLRHSHAQVIAREKSLRARARALRARPQLY
jgi:hypothetical protein